MLNYIKTLKSVTIIPNKGKPIVIPCESKQYQDICRLLDQGQAKFQEVLSIVDTKTSLKTSNSKFKLDERSGKVVIDGKPLPQALSDRLVEFVKSKLDTSPLEAFWNNLKKNPTESSVESLYAFLEANRVPITDDGHFIVYKRVHSDYKDIHSRTFDNTPGRTVEMPREQVDANRNQTCSRGLHVAAFNYAKNNYGSNSEDKLLEVKVNPRDVVAVPPDYNEQKMRVCKYKVIRVCGKERDDLIYQPKLEKSHKKAKKSKKIIRIPANERELTSDGRGDVNIPNSLLARLGLDLGDKVHVYVADKRSRCVIISARAPKRFIASMPQTIARKSIKIRRPMFKTAKIQDAPVYTVVATQGNLEIKL